MMKVKFNSTPEGRDSLRLEEHKRPKLLFVDNCNKK